MKKVIDPQELLGFMKENPTATNDDLAAHFGVKEVTIRYHKSALRKSGALGYGKASDKPATPQMPADLSVFVDKMSEVFSSARRVIQLEQELKVAQDSLKVATDKAARAEAKLKEYKERGTQWELAKSQGDIGKD